MQNHEPSSYRLDSYSSLVESDLRQLLQKEPKLELYRMIEYFLGFRDQNGGEVERYGGKRLRPAICLYIADLFGKKEAARLFASSLELFHNFTLIHDDIEDHDELRRGRPTVWKLWGVNHGINSGDALGLLATKTLGRAAAKAGENGQKAAAFLSQIYAEVIEGQFLDFTLADALLSSPAVTEESYLRMIEKKSAVLIAASAKAGAMIAGASPACQEALWRYGFNLGRPYQIYDDI
ncbi:MAG: polyprenyl synthetase family protein, partial [Patescibacteria group bacterium]